MNGIILFLVSVGGTMAVTMSETPLEFRMIGMLLVGIWSTIIWNKA